MSILKEFLIYLRKPKYKEKNKTMIWTQALSNIFRLWSLLIIFSFLIGLIVFKIAGIVGLNVQEHSVVELFLTEPIYVLIILGLIWAPLVEELTFRLPLRYSAYNLGYAMAFLFIFVLNILRRLWPQAMAWLPDWILPYTPFNWLEALVYIVFVFSLGWLLSYGLKRFFKAGQIKAWYEKYFICLFYIMAIAFALGHAFNYLELSKFWYLAPLLVLPQFIISLNLGFVRLHYGLRWSMLNHFWQNTILSIPLIFLSFVSEDILKILQKADLDVNQLTDLSQSDSTLIFISFLSSLFFILLILAAAINLLWDHWLWLKNKSWKDRLK